MKPYWITMLGVCSFGLFSGQLALGQICAVSNSNLNGPYGYVASEPGTTSSTTGAGTTGTGSTGTGTTGTGTTGTGTTGSSSPTFSNTNIGELLGGIAGGTQFGLSGILLFDGNGHIQATSSATSATAQVGTYNVNPDCSISVSLTDVFGATTSTVTTSATQLAGVILGRGAEIDLTSASNLQTTTTTTTGSGSTTTTTAQNGLTIKLVRVLYSNGCSVSNLSGLYGFVLNPIAIQTSTTGTGTTGTTGTGTTGTGTTTTGTTTTTTATQQGAIFGYVDFDGAGHIIAVPAVTATATNPFGAPAPTPATFSSLDYTGTYTVNPDCSGSMTINNASSSSTTGTGSTGTTGTGTTTGMGTTTSGTSLTIDFVITPPTTTSGQVASANANAHAANGAPELSLSFSNSDEAGWGYASPQ